MTKGKFATRKDIISLLGFLLAGLGILSIILSLTGIQFSFLAWMDELGAGTAFVARLVMIVVGFVILFINRSERLHGSKD